MARHVLTVEDVFDIPAFGGLLVVPGPLQSEWDGPLEMGVALLRPDGTTMNANLKMQHVFQTPPPKELRWICIIKGTSKYEVPIGTEVLSQSA